MNLKNTIEALYETFAAYPLKSSIEGCPCCVSGSDKDKLHTAALRDLTSDNLSRYSNKAMTTWGDTDDFRHFLPRILELVAEGKFDPAALRKLNYGEWKTWPENEQAAVKDFLLAWWQAQIQNEISAVTYALMDLYKVTGDMDLLLSKWNISIDDNSIRNYTDFVWSDYNDLNGERKHFKELDESAADKFLHWVQSQAAILEQAFFHFETIDTDLANHISVTLFIIEQNNS